MNRAVIVVKFYNRYGCKTTGQYEPVCNVPIFFYNRMYSDGTFPVVIQEKDGSIDQQRNKWELVPAPGDGRYNVRMCGVCSHGPCCFYWVLRRHWFHSELVAKENPNDDPKAKAVFHFKWMKKGYVINACNDYGSCRYEMTWQYWKGQTGVKWIYFHHYRDEGVLWRMSVQPSKRALDMMG